MALYVQSEDKLVYQVEMKAMQASEFYYLLDLNLVCGWDYVNPDENDTQGYVAPNNFIEEVQNESLTFYPLTETIIERLEEDGYKEVNLRELKAEHIIASL